MGTDAHTPVPVRPSAQDRERVVRLLRDGSVDGRLSTDTFARRVELAYEAKSDGELAELTRDVRARSGPRRLLLAAVEWLSGLRSDIDAAWSGPRVPALALPSEQSVRMMVGRAPNCDCVVPEQCVSRRHAQIWREGDRWYLRELGSRNGTRVNGTRVIERVELRPGDRVSLGGATYRVRPPA